MSPPSVSYLLDATAALLAQNPPAAGGPEPDFKPYIFWAYASVCVLLFLFSIWIVASARRLERRVGYLEERFREAHPES